MECVYADFVRAKKEMLLYVKPKRNEPDDYCAAVTVAIPGDEEEDGPVARRTGHEAP